MRGLEVADGRDLTDDDVQTAARVAVIGQTVLDELFPSDANPLDQFITAQRCAVSRDRRAAREGRQPVCQ